MAEDKRAEKVAVGRKMLEKFKKKNKEINHSPRKNSLEDSGGTVVKDQKTDTNNVEIRYKELENVNIKSLAGDNILTDSQYRDRPKLDKNNEGDSNFTRNDAPISQMLFNVSPPRIRHNSASDFFDNFSPKTVDITQSLPLKEEVVPTTEHTVLTDNSHLSYFQSTSSNDEITSSSSSQVAFPLQNSPDIFNPTSISNYAMQNVDIQFKESEIKRLEEQEKDKQLENKLKEYKSDISKLEETLADVKKQTGSKVAALEEKLELHCKTLEILVGEKTELQNALSKCQEELRIKLGEMEELQSRLKASRHRVFDLEREINQAKEQVKQFEILRIQEKNAVTVLNSELTDTRKQLEERDGEVLNLKGQLEVKVRNVTILEKELEEKLSQLSLSQLRVQQLSNADDTTPLSEIDQLQQDKLNLEQKVIALENGIKSFKTQSEDTNHEYQQYINSLNIQIQNLTAKDEEKTNQLSEAIERNEQLIKHLSDMEKQLQNQNRLKVAVPSPVDPVLQKQVTQLQEEKTQLEEKLREKISESENLKTVLESKMECIEKLESSLERLDSEKLDAVSLQAAIESDKVAASRAMAQNNTLKKQLQELEDAFVKLSNNKLELTEKLEHEQHLSKDLSVKLTQMTQLGSHNGVNEEEKSQQTDTTVMFTSSSQTLETGGNTDTMHSEDTNPPEAAEEIVESTPVLENITENPQKVETAGKIMALLSDISSTKLVEGLPDQNINFHPCPWCSGRLITV
uniref:Golgin subfamily A conserved domain-containing protein n=1 Tax=Clastoptera arizonana TaxID=38151 RepID=A0A1B6C729_9HEMI